MVDSNNVWIEGKLNNLNIIWQNDEEAFYKGTIDVVRNSNYIDQLPITVSGKLLKDIDVDSLVQIKGQIRSKDTIENDKLKVKLYLYCTEICNLLLPLNNNCKNESENGNKNYISLSGYICKKPNLRTTPSGKQIVDVLIACNYGKDRSAYIPCIAWGRRARQISKLNVGDYTNVEGRFQSRSYTKIIDGISYDKVAYELQIEKIKEKEGLSFSSLYDNSDSQKISF